MAVAFDYLIHDVDQCVQLLGNFQHLLGLIGQNVGVVAENPCLIALHFSLFALNVHDLGQWPVRYVRTALPCSCRIAMIAV
jgi:hypothetical protein